MGGTGASAFEKTQMLWTSVIGREADASGEFEPNTPSSMFMICASKVA